MTLKNKCYITRVILSCKTTTQVDVAAHWLSSLYKQDVYDDSDVELLELCSEQKQRIKRG